MIRHRHWRESESEPDGAVARPMRGPTEHGACQHCAATNTSPPRAGRRRLVGARSASTSTSRLRHGGGSGPPQRRHPRPAATALSPHARARHARARRSVMTEDAVPVMTERIKKPGAASHTAARRLGGATGDARAPQNSSEERESHACACATPYWRGAETLRGKLRSSLSLRGKPGPPSRGPAVRPAVSTPSLSTPLPLSSGHARRAAPPAIYGRRAGVRCARIYAWGSGDLRDQAADGRRSRYSPLTSYLTLPYLTVHAHGVCGVSLLTLTHISQSTVITYHITLHIFICR